MGLITEFSISEQEQAEEASMPVLESINDFLQVMVAKVKNTSDDGFLEEVDLEKLARQLAALMILGKAESRTSIDDFSKVDSTTKLCQKFYEFLKQVNTPHADKIFGSRQTADEFLVYIGKTWAKSLSSEWEDTLEKAQSGDTKAIDRVKAALGKLQDYYSVTYKKLETQFLDKEFNKKNSELDQMMGSMT